MLQQKPAYEPSQLLATKELQATLLQALSEAKEIVVVAGYASVSGFEILRPTLVDCLDRGGNVTLLIGIDRAGVAGAELVRSIGKLLKKKYEGRVEVLLVVERAATFLHAKVFFTRKSGIDHLLVGSANLTKKGLSQNHELVLHQTGILSHHRKSLLDFIGAILGKRTLTSQNVEQVAGEMERRPTAPKVDERRAEEQAQFMRKLLASLGEEEGESNLPDSEATLDLVSNLVRQGRFLNHEFDLDKLSIPAGLAHFKSIGILSAATFKQAGTSDVKQPGITATFGLLPADLRKTYRRVALRLGKALNRYGFETPFGYWVPEPYVSRLEKAFVVAARDLPVATQVEGKITKHVNAHRKKLGVTINGILREAKKGGLHRPREWKSRPRGDLGAFKVLDDDGKLTWGKAAKADVTKLLKQALTEDAERQLVPSLAVARVRRLRPQLVPIEVRVGEDFESAAIFLSCLTWQVAEHALKQGRKITRHAVADAFHVSGGSKKAGKQFVELSELLQEPAHREKAMGVFFKLFPKLNEACWTSGLKGGPVEPDDDGEDGELE